MEPLAGRFIVLDGIDFCGKGTQARLLSDYLMSHPRDDKFKLISVLSTRNPSNSPYTMQIRDVLQSESDPSAKMEHLAKLFVQDRKHHFENVIDPALSSGIWVICDRYMYSTLAYQNAQGMPINQLLDMHEGLPVPDAVFIIDISGEESLRRKAVKKDKRPDEMFDRLEFQEKLAENYRSMRSLLAHHPIHLIDGTKSKEQIHEEIRKEVDKLVHEAYEEGS